MTQTGNALDPAGRPGPAEYSPLRRIVLGLFICGGNAAYAASFLSGSGERQWRVATAIAVAAAVSWPIFGGLILFVTRARPGLWAWVDLCLRIMAVGIAVLVTLAFFNWLRPGSHEGQEFSAGHGAVLVFGHLLMLGSFVLGAQRLGVSPAKSVLLWGAGLCIPFVLLLLLQSRLGVF